MTVVAVDTTKVALGETERPPLFEFGTLLAIGAWVRIWAFALRGPLWTDEAGLALNIVGRDLNEIARPFVYQQVAPYFYVLSEKLVTALAGTSEHALRLLSLVAGLLLLPAITRLTRRVASWPAALFALAFMVPNQLIVRYATELKPYESDAFIATGLCLLAVEVLSATEKRGRFLFALGAAGVVAPWFSLPSAFVLAAIGVALMVDGLERGLGLRAWLAPVMLGFPWLISFVLHYVGFLQIDASQAADLHDYWARREAFAPFPPHSLADVRWYIAKLCYLFDLFVAPGGFGLRYVATGVWLFGMVTLWRTRKSLFVLFCLPILLMFAVSATHRYVVADRLLLFLVPILLTPTACGLAVLASWRGPRTQLLAAAVAVLFCSAPTLGLSRSLAKGSDGAGIALVVDYLQRHYRAGDRLYVESQVEWVYTFYARNAGLNAPWSIADDRLYEPSPSYTTLDSLAGAERVWVLVPALGETGPAHDARAASWISKADRLVTERLARYGHAIDSLDGDNVRLYLYDLTRPQRP